jgi:hypothetical protein
MAPEGREGTDPSGQFQAFLISANPQAVRIQAEKIASSKTFRTSERMSRLLRFVVQRSLAGQGSELKEYLLGVEVFDRTSAFDPRTDPIVRVEARRLRSKLKAYYEGEGQEDDLIIEIPRAVMQLSSACAAKAARRQQWRRIRPPASPCCRSPT